MGLSILPVLLHIFFSWIREIAGRDEKQNVRRLRLGPRQSILKFRGWNCFPVMFAVYKPDIGEVAAVYILTLLVGNYVSATVGGAALFRCPLSPIEIAKPNPAKQVKAELFEAHAC